MAKPLVSILIPVYNRKELVRRTVESAINQTYENIEIIAVDNKSTDRTYEVLKEFAEKYPNMAVYQNEENLGPVRNWKNCLKYSSGEFIKILFSDDWIEKTFVEECMEILLAHDDVGFVFTPAYEIDIESVDKVTLWHKVFREKKILNTDVFIRGALLQKNIFPNSPGCALFRREHFSESLLIDIPNRNGIDHSKTGAGNDLLIFMIMATKYDKFGFIQEPLTYFGSHKDSISKRETTYLLFMSYWLAKLFFANVYCDGELRKKVYTRFYFDYLIHFKKLLPLTKVRYCIDIRYALKLIINRLRRGLL